MIQDQLVEYISSQMKLGVSQDAIKATLTGAGWAVADVEDTLKKINSASPATAMPAAAKPAASSPMVSSFSATASPTAKAADKGPEPQTIRVSDLISASSSSAVSTTTPATQSKVSPLSSGAISAGRPVAQPTSTVMANPKKAGGKFPMTVVWIILVVIFAGLAGYFFYQNTTLSSQVGTVNTQTQGVSGQVSALNAQVQALTASSTNMAEQLTSLGVINQSLKTELSFFMIPSGLAATTTNFSLSGILSGGKPLFSFVTTDGVKASVKNSADANVRLLLQPLASSSQVAQVTGTYVPGSSLLTVLTVNGTSAYPPAPSAPPVSTTTSAAPATTVAPAATTTATNTAAAASIPPAATTTSSTTTP